MSDIDARLDNRTTARLDRTVSEGAAAVRESRIDSRARIVWVACSSEMPLPASSQAPVKTEDVQNGHY